MDATTQAPSDQEVLMPLSRKEMRGGRSFAAPLTGIVLLVLCYLVLAEWQDIPQIITNTLAAVHWPA
jgi:hypothetical protein